MASQEPQHPNLTAIWNPNASFLTRGGLYYDNILQNVEKLEQRHLGRAVATRLGMPYQPRRMNTDRFFAP